MVTVAVGVAVGVVVGVAVGVVVAVVVVVAVASFQLREFSMNTEQRLKNLAVRYFRKTISSPDGDLVHHSDCGKYMAGCCYCTCGLVHDLCNFGSSLAGKLADVRVRFHPVAGYRTASQGNVEARQALAEVFGRVEPEPQEDIDLRGSMEWLDIMHIFGVRFHDMRRTAWEKENASD